MVPSSRIRRAEAEEQKEAAITLVRAKELALSKDGEHLRATCPPASLGNPRTGWFRVSII